MVNLKQLKKVYNTFVKQILTGHTNFTNVRAIHPHK